MTSDENLNIFIVEVSDEDAGRRLDHVLSAHVPDLSRTRLQALVRQGCVEVATHVISDPGAKVRSGQQITVTVPEPEPARPVAETIALTVAYEDRDLIVIDKPAGLVVHPAPGHRTGPLVNALIAHCGDSLSGIGGERRPGIVHRLDKDTSGLLVVAKTDVAHRGLAKQFAAHGRDGRLQRKYLALVWGHFERPKDTIDAPLGRSRANRTKMAVLSGERGQEAVTHLSVVARYASALGQPLASLVEASLETGRTHQIRVHMAHVGHPVIGDPVYGSGFKTSANRLGSKSREAISTLGRQALHAYLLGFEHPISGQNLCFESPLPGEMMDLKRTLAGERDGQV